jgi:hypothetical protein
MLIWLPYIVGVSDSLLVLIRQVSATLERTRLAARRRARSFALITLALVVLGPLPEASARPRQVPPTHDYSLFASWSRTLETCDVWHPLGCLGDSSTMPSGVALNQEKIAASAASCWLFLLGRAPNEAAIAQRPCTSTPSDVRGQRTEFSRVTL